MRQLKSQLLAARNLHREGRKRLITLLSFLLLGVIYLSIPQIGHMFGLPALRLTDDDLVLRAGFWVFVLGLPVLYIALAFAVVPSPPPSSPATRSGAWQRFLQWADRATRPLVAFPDGLKRLRDRRTSAWGLVAGGLVVVLSAALFLLPPRLGVSLYPANDHGASLLFFSLFALLGVWLALPPSTPDTWPHRFQSYTRLRTAVGRAIFFLLVTNALGELLWHLPPLAPSVFTFRNYTLWALIHIGFLVVLWGRVSDSASDRVRWKLVAAVVLLLLTWAWQWAPTRLAPPPEMARGSLGSTRAAPVDVRESTTEVSLAWLHALEHRLAEVPPDEPALFLALSGGGSRASLFAALALDTLRRTAPDESDAVPGSADKSLYDQVVLISSVSGGSVAAAHFAVHSGVADAEGYQPVNSFAAEIQGLVGEAAEEFRALAEEKLRGTTDRSPVEQWDRAISTYVRPFQDESAPPKWPLSSPLVDAMTTDFMAPLLRGLLLPGVERGESVRAFWKSRLDWGSVDTTRPLLVINTSEVLSGRRLAVGAPPLPPGFFGESARTLSTLHPAYAVDLATAVRISANFPWGFSIPSVTDFSGTKKDDVLLIDGGVVDNTGVDSIDFVMSGLDRLAHAPAEAVTPEVQRVARACLEGLRSRGLLVIEVDSGAKPFSPGYLSTSLPGLFAPFSALKRASFAQAALARQFHMTRIQDTMRVPARGASQTTAAGEEERSLALVKYGTFLCNEDRNVMTAWALGPADKAAVIARFFYERDERLNEIWQRMQEIKADVALLSQGSSAPPATPEASYLSNALQDRQQTEKAALLDSLEAAERQRAFEQAAPGVAQLAPPSVREAVVGWTHWVFLGTYDERRGAWRTQYFTMPAGPPEELAEGAEARAIGRSNVRENMPTAAGTFAPVVGILEPGAVVRILDVQRWADTGFVWARVTSESSSNRPGRE